MQCSTQANGPEFNLSAFQPLNCWRVRVSSGSRGWCTSSATCSDQRWPSTSVSQWVSSQRIRLIGLPLLNPHRYLNKQDIIFLNCAYCVYSDILAIHFLFFLPQRLEIMGGGLVMWAFRTFFTSVLFNTASLTYVCFELESVMYNNVLTKRDLINVLLI